MILKPIHKFTAIILSVIMVLSIQFFNTQISLASDETPPQTTNQPEPTAEPSETSVPQPSVAVKLESTPFSISGKSNNSSYGTVTGSGTYYSGTTVTLSAIPNNGYRFVRWVETGSRSAKYTFIATEDRTITAEFASIDTPVLTAESADYESVRLNWTQVNGANGYEVFRSTNKYGTYSKIATMTSGSTLSYTKTGLIANKTYYFKVRAYSTARTGTTFGNMSSVQSATPIISTPTATSKASGYYAIRVSWSAVPGASGYEIYRATKKYGTYSRVYIASSSSTSFLNTGLTGDKTYYYKVRGYRTVGRTTVYTNYSGIESAKTLFPIGSATVEFSGASSVVSGQTLTYNYTLNVKDACAANANIGVGGVFEKVSDEIDNLFYDTIPKNSSGSISGSITVKVADNAQPGQTGEIFVIPNDSHCATLIFDSSGKPIGDPYITNVTGSKIATVAGPPTTPVLVAAIPAGFDAIKVTWGAVSNISGYEILRSTRKYGTYTRVAVVSASSTSYTNTGLTMGRTYYYKIRAYCNIPPTIYSSFSASASAAPLPGAPYVNPISTSYTAIMATWTAVSGADGYEVWYATNKYGTYSLKYTSNSGTSGSWTRGGLTTDKTYYFKVRAFQTVGGERVYGGFSSIQSTAPGRPSMTVTRALSTSATITWIAITGSDGYEVWRSTQKYGTYALKYTAPSSTTSWINKNLTTGKAYYYKVRTYRMVDGVKVYSQFSSINSVVP